MEYFLFLFFNISLFSIVKRGIFWISNDLTKRPNKYMKNYQIHIKSSFTWLKPTDKSGKMSVTIFYVKQVVLVCITKETINATRIYCTI